MFYKLSRAPKQVDQLSRLTSKLLQNSPFRIEIPSENLAFEVFNSNNSIYIEYSEDFDPVDRNVYRQKTYSENYIKKILDDSSTMDVINSIRLELEYNPQT